MVLRERFRIAVHAFLLVTLSFCAPLSSEAGDGDLPTEVSPDAPFRIVGSTGGFNAAPGLLASTISEGALVVTIDVSPTGFCVGDSLVLTINLSEVVIDAIADVFVRNVATGEVFLVGTGDFSGDFSQVTGVFDQVGLFDAWVTIDGVKSNEVRLTSVGVDVSGPASFTIGETVQLQGLAGPPGGTLTFVDLGGTGSVTLDPATGEVTGRLPGAVQIGATYSVSGIACNDPVPLEITVLEPTEPAETLVLLDFLTEGTPIELPLVEYEQTLQAMADASAGEQWGRARGRFHYLVATIRRMESELGQHDDEIDPALAQEIGAAISLLDAQSREIGFASIAEYVVVRPGISEIGPGESLRLFAIGFNSGPDRLQMTFDDVEVGSVTARWDIPHTTSWVPRSDNASAVVEEPVGSMTQIVAGEGLGRLTVRANSRGLGPSLAWVDVRPQLSIRGLPDVVGMLDEIDLEVVGVPEDAIVLWEPIGNAVIDFSPADESATTMQVIVSGGVDVPRATFQVSCLDSDTGIALGKIFASPPTEESTEPFIRAIFHEPLSPRTDQAVQLGVLDTINEATHRWTAPPVVQLVFPPEGVTVDEDDSSRVTFSREGIFQLQVSVRRPWEVIGGGDSGDFEGQFRIGIPVGGDVDGNGSADVFDEKVRRDLEKLRRFQRDANLPDDLRQKLANALDAWEALADGGGSLASYDPILSNKDGTLYARAKLVLEEGEELSIEVLVSPHALTAQEQIRTFIHEARHVFRFTEIAIEIQNLQDAEALMIQEAWDVIDPDRDGMANIRVRNGERVPEPDQDPASDSENGEEDAHAFEEEAFSAYLDYLRQGRGSRGGGRR